MQSRTIKSLKCENSSSGFNGNVHYLYMLIALPSSPDSISKTSNDSKLLADNIVYTYIVYVMCIVSHLNFVSLEV